MKLNRSDRRARVEVGFNQLDASRALCGVFRHCVNRAPTKTCPLPWPDAPPTTPPSLGSTPEGQRNESGPSPRPVVARPVPYRDDREREDYHPDWRRWTDELRIGANAPDFSAFTRSTSRASWRPPGGSRIKTIAPVDQTKQEQLSWRRSARNTHKKSILTVSTVTVITVTCFAVTVCGVVHRHGCVQP